MTFFSILHNFNNFEITSEIYKFLPNLKQYSKNTRSVTNILPVLFSSFFTTTTKR